MLKVITTTVIECDCCDERFGDLAEQSRISVTRAAKAAGWDVTLNHERCPACSSPSQILACVRCGARHFDFPVPSHDTELGMICDRCFARMSADPFVPQEASNVRT